MLDLNAVVGNATTARLLRTLEAGARHVPIVAVAPESESEQVSCLSAGVDHLVTLPFDLGAVQSLLVDQAARTTQPPDKSPT